MTTTEQERMRQKRKWRREEEQAVKVIRDFAAKRLRRYSHSECARILSVVAALGV